MTDTPLHVRRMQGEIIRKKPLSERLHMVFEMMEGGQRMVTNLIRKQHPDWSDGQLKAAVFERIYRDDFPADDMNRIMEAMTRFYDRKKD